MKKVLDNLSKNKYISLFMATLLAFAYMGGARKYIYDNCSKILDFARMGTPWFNLSSGMAVLMVIAVCVGVAVTFLLRKKITMDWIFVGYIVAGIFSILTLIITPYNLQLLSPSTHMDAFATLTLIVALVFSLVVVALLSASISAHIVIVLSQDNIIATIVSSSVIVISSIFASLSVAYAWSLQIYFIVLTALLIVLYVPNVFCKKANDEQFVLANAKMDWIYISIVLVIAVLAIISALTSSALVVEKMIQF